MAPCPSGETTLQEKVPEIKESGAQLVALTPEFPDKSPDNQQQNKLESEGLSDLNEFNGEHADNDWLPLAATYIVAQIGTIRWHFIKADYRQRAKPSDTVDFLKKMP